MKLLFSLLSICVFTSSINTQPELILVNPGQDIISCIPEYALYASNTFIDGIVHYKNGKKKQHKMNYNVLFGRMQYINSRGDTLSIEDDNIDFVELGKDTFFRDRFYYKVLRDYDKIRLVSRSVIAVVSRQKTTTGTIYNSYEVINNGYYLRGVAAKDTVLFSRFDLYYVADVKNRVQTLHRENLIEMYPHRKKALLDYLYEHTVHLNNLQEVEKMLELVTNKKHN